ncbi:MAG TPA: glycosyltransferase [Bradyrhizobium sp.]|uniref:glycosyltransferase n=1 Tax=Bradyrhizobium sp. TaxID=376 RepID=UPI002BF50252|nr:glycosyltransferase [Bradyrhizobium sp.]HLZ03970.1 glycosyltransferase [Bradyrhizobium sp.]
MTIPARIHFCWIGSSLPWAYVFAILSAAERGELPEIILHHTDPLEDGAELRALNRTPGVRLSRIDPLACLTEAGQRLGMGEELAALYRGLDSPVVRADILRAAILYLQGGVYLDLDTITTQSLLPLLGATQFVGSEFIVWPLAVRASRSPLVWARHLTLDVLRKMLRRMPNGWKAFRRIEEFYFRGVNNAVMGACENSPFLADYLRAMVAVPAARRAEAYALGPDLLQEVVDRYRQGDLIIQEPCVFYPLPPRISEQWFRIARGMRLDGVLSAETRVVHWYASVRTKARVAQIDPDYVRKHQKNQLYSALVCACIRNLPQAA